MAYSITHIKLLFTIIANTESIIANKVMVFRLIILLNNTYCVTNTESVVLFFGSIEVDSVQEWIHRGRFRILHMTITCRILNYL